MNGMTYLSGLMTRPAQRAATLAALGFAIALGGAARLAAGQIDHPAVARAIEISDAFKLVAEEVRPSVARITGYTAGGAKVTGSGFVIDEQGHLLTNNHVVESAVSLLAEFSNGVVRAATLVGADPLTDLAVIRIDDDAVVALPFATSDRLEVGEWVVAVGFPLGLDQTVTVGVISATNRRLNIIGASIGRRGYEDFIQTDAAINRGNSGGPLLNLRGEVVGVNAAIVTQTGGSDGLGFAIPTRLARYIARELIARGRVVRAWLGVGLQDITPALAASYGLPRDATGVLLTSISPNEPASRAGLQTEDILVAINDQDVIDVEDLRNQVAMMEPGKRILVNVYRAGRPRTFEVILDEMRGADAATRPMIDPRVGGRLGVRLEDLSQADLNSLGETSGVVVTQIVPGRAAQLSGIEDGDIVVELNGETLRTERVGYNQRSAAKWLFETIESARPGTVVRFTLRRRVLDGAGRIIGYEPVRSFVAIELQ